jgi:uncharacterized membrane protein
MGNRFCLRQSQRVVLRDVREFEMNKLSCVAVVAVAVVCAGFAGSAEAKCFRKSASGTASSLDGAKFQVKEAILQSFDWGVWAAFMASGSTPGYRVTSNGYKCSPGGLGHNCRGTSTICKTG